ncbi:MAG: PA2779 family protein [Vicinamibacterales bacterium]
MRRLASVLVVLLTVITAAPRLSAQTSHAAPQAAIDAALQQHVNAADAERGRVQRLLEREEIRSVAGQAGIDLHQVTSAVATMSAQELAQVAAQAQQVEQALAGGQSRVVISTTVIIIALLVLILLIVALD